MASAKNEEKTVLEAETVFLLMKKGFPISRNVRAQWLLEHLDSVISIQCPSVKSKEAPELEIVSVLPKDKPTVWSIDTSHQFLYKVVSTTSIIFLGHKYRMVFSLDLSPSLATVDIQHGEIVIDEVCLATKRCLEGITRPFTIPGSKRVMQPEIYVTVIAHTPFYTNPAQQVLVQGWLITADNVNSLTQYVEKQLYLLEERVATVTAIANQQLEHLRAESERLVGGLFEESGNCLNKSSSSCTANISMVSPEASFVNMLRYGMLALTLLPEHSCAHMVIVSDGIVGVKDVHALDSIVQQLRATTVACSFLHVGSAYHPHCADGLVPYQDLLYFIAAATLGSYMSFNSYVVSAQGTDMNLYHRNFLCWQLYRDVPYDSTPDNHNCWRTENNCFDGHKTDQLLRKKQIDDKVTCTLSSLLCCRLREGYLIKRASIRDDVLEINFVLLWKSNVSLEYLVTCPWSAKSLSQSNVIQYVITIEAPYEFLHDITCLSKKPLKSNYRQGVVSCFWAALTSLTESDNTLAHFSWFPGSGWTWYSVPDTIRSGMPVFYLSSYPSLSTVQLSDAACPQFGQIWQPVVSLDPLQWARWMHTQRVTLILSYDRPLPRHLHQANQSGRFQCVQSRQAAAVLYAMLKTWATFVLIENHTYVQFIYREAEKPPVSFSLIRINCKALCVVLNIAFAGGTEGVVRHNVVVDLVDRLSKLTLPNRPTEQRETPCCTIIHKSLERILIRYERIPNDLSMVVFPDGTQPTWTRTASVLGGSLTTTLSRYLYHNRWLWHVKRPFVQTIPGITLPKLNITAIARILSTITKIRLTEGFNFAYSAAGITNMVLEVQMQGFENNKESYPCIIQYILFPPHAVSSATLERDSGSEEDTEEGTADGEASTQEDCESSSEYQIVTEVWIEPQSGYVQMPTQPTATYMHPLQYHQLPDAIARVDEECINALMTLEYLSLLSQVVPAEKSTEIVFGQPHQGIRYHSVTDTTAERALKCPNPAEFFETTPRIHPMYFSFDTLSILPKCQQAELLFSMFANDSVHIDEDRNSANKILMENFLEHIKQLHNKELLFTSAESQKFTRMLLNRPRENGPLLPFFVQGEKNYQDAMSDIYPRWKCFVKGISTTHVILTILPATEKDVRLITYPTYAGDNCTSNNSEKNFESDVFDLDMNEKILSPTLCAKDTNMSDFPTLERRESKISSQSTTADSTSKANAEQNFAHADNEGGLVIPVYVYDCSLALLIDTLVGRLQTPQNKDIYQDHTFKIGQEVCEDFINLKPESNTKPSSPEPKSEDSDNISSDQRSLMEHCKLLSLAHCHCYVVAVYKSLALQQSLSYEDMEAAVGQCEENLIEINITNYIRSVCRHLSTLPKGSLLDQFKVSACNDVKPLHNLIKDKFKRIMAAAFRPVPAHPEFYYCLPSWVSDKMEVVSQRTDSDEFTFHSEILDPNIDNSPSQVNQATNITWPAVNLHNSGKLSHRDSTESLISDLQEENTWDKEHPLFLQLSCSIHFRSELSSIPVKVVPTCFTEIIQRINDNKKNLAEQCLDDLKITLDIICLNLPKEVLEVSLERYPSLRATSYCSASPFGSVRTDSGSSPTANAKTEPMQERMPNLPLYQHTAIISLKDEIEWLLRDETVTALLDDQKPSLDTLRFIAHHVSDSTGRSSCSMDKVPLHFVFSSESSTPKFLHELKKLHIDKYCICHEEKTDLFYFIKESAAKDEAKPETETDALHVDVEEPQLKKDESAENLEQEEISVATIQISGQDSGDAPGYSSEISSIAEGKHGTDDGYDGDSSNSEDDFQWLIELDKRRDRLPNFWLILTVENSDVNVYFHCRFLELSSPEVDCYSQIQKMLIVQIKAICRRVNQYLLLQSLHDTRMCDPLLEPESSEDHTWRGEIGGETGSLFQNHASASPGMFRCPVIWEEPFSLHPRLKTGPGRSGLSRGITAMHAVLNRLFVNNRNNMFVYQENNKNVFYLRLHEQTNDGKSLQNKLSESDEKLVVSRSNSVASLSRAKGIGLTNDPVMSDDTRPRVRSFGEKESDILNKTGDSIILMVHGISEAGPAVKRDLVQALQNRLDDAVLEVLSVMLARNPMCKLTPADVHFIQKPYKFPESIVQLSVQPYCVPHIDALGYYLRQNILQFLYTPKYTDLDMNHHFQDYSPLDGWRKRAAESDIFLYNQSYNSSGSKGIACIALAIIIDKGELTTSSNDGSNNELSFPKLSRVEDFEDIVSTIVYKNKDGSKPNAETFIEFRIWKQGRVNLDVLLQKLSSAVQHGTWDLMMEYNLLATPLTEPEPISFPVIKETTAENKETQTSVKPQSPKATDNSIIDQYELGEEGKLNEIYHTTLAQWFQFALTSTMGVPAVKKHEVIIHHRHAIPVIVKELQNLIRCQDPDTSSRAFVLQDRQPFLNQFVVSHKVGSTHKWSENIRNKPTAKDNTNREGADSPAYIPHDFNKDEQTSCTKCILVARNFYQWKASSSRKIDPELLAPKDQKQLQKFNPLISESNFVPRQRILLAEVQSDNIIIYLYNWSKEKSEKLMKQATSLGTWLSSRSSLFTNINMQKLGIFHHKFTRDPQQREHGSSQYYQITDMESLAKFPSQSNADSKDWTRSSNRAQAMKSNAFSWTQVVGQAMRDAKPSAPYPLNTTDPIVKAAYDLQDLRHREKRIKEDLEKLYAMWQSRTPNIPLSLNASNTFKQYSRLIHFCHTPLLFLPAWRLQSAATRDHSLTPPSSLFSLNNNAQQQSPQTTQPKQKAANTILIKWHQELCKSMLTEYKQYLQILGFNPIQVESPHKTDEEHAQQQSYYLKKSMLGGVLLFEIHLSQPFFIVKLSIIECNRLQTKTSSGMVNQFVLSFVDACDKIKINMHLHSFTYDFHLRCIHSYIAGTGPWSLQQGYHLTRFLDDFIKYYSKAPNYARNLIYSDVITVHNIAIPARTLYSYLLSHDKLYGMRVISSELQESHDNEYVLIKLQSTPLVSYCDAQDTRYTDDFDVALIVSRVEQPPQLEKTEITLKYYLMLTSKRELYPKREVENNKLGKFRTVYSVGRSTTSSYTDSPVESSPVSPIPPFVRGNSRTEMCIDQQTDKTLDLNGAVTKETSEAKDAEIKAANYNVYNNLAPTPPPVPNSPLAQSSSIPNTTSNMSTSSPHLVQIRQESVNYLGYYSSHEQLMQQLIMSQAQAAHQHITNMVDRGALQCRTHLLWDKLLENKSTMTYTEFKELCSLAHIESLPNLDPRLRPLVNQPVSWYQALSKVLQNKYQENHKQFNTSDGNITHHLILHPSLFQAFMMLTIDLHTSRGDLCAVYRKSNEINVPVNIEDVYTLIEGFVNACCFHLWMGLCSQ
ncbi:KICSTOR complex protein SZT2-like [Odontomachus brunneus]|uniref:KICSTOR complex protein SZT2-like n=1 Tax=Odontomachus brunneus TaxID=486640 RepID=UPI0013F22D46|nr:KICSTOR complex protein SZT2-like [Odontomachus brunneus]